MDKTAKTDWKALHGSHFRDSLVLVTGGAGFIGSHLTEALVTLGARVRVLDDLSGGCLENLAGAGSIEFMQGSILDEERLGRGVADCRYIFHQAAKGSVPKSLEEPALYQQVNSTGTFNVLEAARRGGVSRVVFASSGSVYGNCSVPWAEGACAMPRHPYAASKLSGEAFMRAYASSYRLDTVSLRYFNVFGPRQNPKRTYASVVPAFADTILNGRSPIIHGDGHQSRDFTHVSNVVHANLLAARMEARLGGDVINVGCGTEVSIVRLAGLMATSLGRSDLRPSHEPRRPGDSDRSLADLTRAGRVLGYEPVTSFTEGLDQTLSWYVGNRREVEGEPKRGEWNA